MLHWLFQQLLLVIIAIIICIWLHIIIRYFLNSFIYLYVVYHLKFYDFIIYIDFWFSKILGPIV